MTIVVKTLSDQVFQIVREQIVTGQLGDEMPIRQDARVYASVLAPGEAVTHALGAGRRAWVQVVRGTLSLNALSLAAGDGVGIADVAELGLRAGTDCELLLFDLP